MNFHQAIANQRAKNAEAKKTEADIVSLDIEPETHKPAAPVLSDDQKWQAIGDVMERVWLGLTENLKRPHLLESQYQEWVETLAWALVVMPAGYALQREMIQADIEKYQNPS